MKPVSLLRRMVPLTLALFLLAGCAAGDPAASVPGGSTSDPAQGAASSTPTGLEQPFVFTRDNLPRLDGSTSTVPLAKALCAVLLGESREEVEALEKYLQETYPGIQIAGSAADVAGEEFSADSMINELNSFSPDVIVSGLQGIRQDRFLMEHRQKINGKIWLGLGEHPDIQNEAGLKVSWWNTLLKKTTFRRLAAKFKGDKGE